MATCAQSQRSINLFMVPGGLRVVAVQEGCMLSRLPAQTSGADRRGQQKAPSYPRHGRASALP
eukprot:3454817-Pyramimonas_sp.AAC.1